LSGIIGFILKVIFWGWLFKSAVDYWSSFNNDYQQLPSIVRQTSQLPPNEIPSHFQDQFSTAMWKAQSDLSHLDQLRRQRGELMISDMKCQAVSLGIFVD